MKEYIENLRKHLFNYSMNEYNSTLNETLKVLEQSIGTLDPTNVNKCMTIMGKALNALSSKDYLYCTDLLEYEIMPLLNEVTK